MWVDRRLLGPPGQHRGQARADQVEAGEELPHLGPAPRHQGDPGRLGGHHRLGRLLGVEVGRGMGDGQVAAGGIRSITVATISKGFGLSSSRKYVSTATIRSPTGWLMSRVAARVGWSRIDLGSRRSAIMNAVSPASWLVS